MDIHKRSLQIGSAVLLCALVLRLGGGMAGKLVHALGQPEVAATLLFLETGRVVRAAAPQAPHVPSVQANAEAADPTEEAAANDPAPAVFSKDDIKLVALNNRTSNKVDVSPLLQKPLSWDLTQNAPTVLIYHTHGTESYTKTENYQESSSYRTRDNGYNMVSIGTAVTEALTKAGISVIHDTVPHDYPSYDGSYSAARKSIQQYLQEYPSIRLVLDLHRDSMTDSSGKQLQSTVDAGGEKAAQIMLVMGTQTGSVSYPNWQENMALAVKLHATLEKRCPGIMRPLCIRAQRFNQDLSSGALLLEMGAAGNTRQQALKSAEILSQAILDLAHGAVYKG